MIAITTGQFWLKKISYEYIYSIKLAFKRKSKQPYLIYILFVLSSHNWEIKHFDCCFSVKKALVFNLGHNFETLNVKRSNAIY